MIFEKRTFESEFIIEGQSYFDFIKRRERYDIDISIPDYSSLEFHALADNTHIFDRSGEEMITCNIKMAIGSLVINRKSGSQKKKNNDSKRVFSIDNNRLFLKSTNKIYFWKILITINN